MEAFMAKYLQFCHGISTVALSKLLWQLSTEEAPGAGHSQKFWGTSDQRQECRDPVVHHSQFGR